MGYFAWKTSDTNETFVASDITRTRGHRVCHQATLVLPDGTRIRGGYSGYGCMLLEDDTAVDIFAAVMMAIEGVDPVVDAKHTEEYRNRFFKDYEGHEDKIRLLANDRGQSFDEIAPSEDCPTQGFFFDRRW